MRRRDEEFWDWGGRRYSRAIHPSPPPELVDEVELEGWGLKRRTDRRRGAFPKSGRGVKHSLKLFLMFGMIATIGLAISGRFDSALMVSGLTGLSFLVSTLILRRWS